MKRWYVAHTKLKAEEIALLNLSMQGFKAFLPRYHRIRRHARKTDVVIAPLFPRYLFVELDIEQDRFLSVDSTRGVAYLLRQNGCPAPLPSGVVESLLMQADVKEVVPLSSLELFELGMKLRILDGAFAGYQGIYERMTDNERVQLLLEMLGRDIRINIPLHAVAKAS